MLDLEKIVREFEGTATPDWVDRVAKWSPRSNLAGWIISGTIMLLLVAWCIVLAYYLTK